MGTISLSAQKLHTHYSFLPQEGGNLYFIMPQKGFQTQDKKAKKKLIYDVAYLYPQDSATVNYTYFHLNTFVTDSFYVSDESGKALYASPSERKILDSSRNGQSTVSSVEEFLPVSVTDTDHDHCTRWRTHHLYDAFLEMGQTLYANAKHLYDS